MNSLLNEGIQLAAIEEGKLSPSHLSTGLSFLKREMRLPGTDSPTGLIPDSSADFSRLKRDVFADADAEEKVAPKWKWRFSHFRPSTRQESSLSTGKERATLPLRR